MDSLIPPPPPIQCDFADQVRLSWSRLLFLSKTILVLCARLISNASQKSTITRYLARGLLTLQYINGGHQITWFVRVNYGDKWHLGNCYSGWVWKSTLLLGSNRQLESICGVEVSLHRPTQVTANTIELVPSTASITALLVVVRK